MFCYQCQETANGVGCTVRGVCGKQEPVADLQDLLIFVTKGLAFWAEKGRAAGKPVDVRAGRFITKALFTTITNANFDERAIMARIREGLSERDRVRAAVSDAGKDGGCVAAELPACATWEAVEEEMLRAKALDVGVLATTNEDIRSLRELVVYGLKGMAAYAHHASDLGHEDPVIYDHCVTALAGTLKDLSVDELVALTMKTGEITVRTLALLDKANTAAYGSPEVTRVNLGVRKNPGILVSGHDLRDLEELLEQSAGSGVDIYTHSEMLPAHSYPKFKQYKHLAGNYGSSWWHQNSDFESFNGPILMTTNCIIPVKGTYQARMFTTGAGIRGACISPTAARAGGRIFPGSSRWRRHALPPGRSRRGR